MAFLLVRVGVREEGRFAPRGPEEAEPHGRAGGRDVPGGHDHGGVARCGAESREGRVGADDGRHVVVREELVREGSVRGDHGDGRDVAEDSHAGRGVARDEEVLAVLHFVGVVLVVEDDFREVAHGEPGARDVREVVVDAELEFVEDEGNLEEADEVELVRVHGHEDRAQ